MPDRKQTREVAPNRIVLTLEGLSGEGGHVDLSVFVNEIGALSEALKKLDKQISRGSPTNYMRVVGLSHSSPATVEVEVCQRKKAADNRAALVSAFYQTTEKVIRGEIPPDLDFGLIEDFKKLTKPIGKELSNAYLEIDTKHLNLGGDFADNLQKFLAGEETALGSVEGRLELINIHGGANIFRIYPEFGPSHINCHFSEERFDDAMAAIGSKVFVAGKLKYRIGASFPHALEVESVDIYPKENELPTFEDLRGIAKDATGEKFSEVFVAEMRDAWV